MLPAEACEQSNQLFRGLHPGFGTSGCKARNKSWNLLTLMLSQNEGIYSELAELL